MRPVNLPEISLHSKKDYLLLTFMILLNENCFPRSVIPSTLTSYTPSMSEVKNDKSVLPSLAGSTAGCQYKVFRKSGIRSNSIHGVSVA